MKFGEQLRSSVIREYAYSYISYDELKAQLKTGYKTDESESPATNGKKKAKPKRIPWTEENEGKFVETLYRELDKVSAKQKAALGEINHRIAEQESHVSNVVQRLQNMGPVDGDHRVANGDAPTEEEFMMLEEELSDVIADVHDLAKYVRLNYTGFQKIIKKHDKQTEWQLKAAFASALKSRPFFQANYDSDIVKLSKLYDIVRTRGHPVKGDSAAGGGQANFIRNTTKYWIHEDNITEVKLIILKHLPVLVFNANKEFSREDTAITSIYYDNPETWDLYEGRLKKTEGAEAIRLRWYGGMDSEKIFVERKTHREDWTGESSVKARFVTKEKNINGYMKGEILPAQLFQKDRDDGKKPREVIDGDEALAKEIQYSVIKNGYVPVCRSYYSRTAFQLPADARVRISLDTELTMVREDNLDGRQRSGDNWRRMDIGVDWPFPQLPEEDIEKFPYAVLEVKLQTQAGQDPPEWVLELISSHLVEAVPKFSKFIHGTQKLFPSRIKLLPFWAQQMDVDIRKPRTKRFGIRRPGNSTQSSSTDDEKSDSDDDDMYDDGSQATLTNDPSETTIRGLHAAHQRAQFAERPELTARDENTTRGNDLDVEEEIAAGSLEDHYPSHYDSDDEDAENDAIEEARRAGGGWPYYSKVLKRQLRLAEEKILATLHTISPFPKASPIPPSTTNPFGDASQVTQTRFKAPPGKKIHVPVRVEPKVYFAAERTFLAWLEFSIYIGTIAVTLLNFGDKPTRLSFVAAGSFTFVAIASLIYSVAIYLKRSTAIRSRRNIKYHDKYGPTILCGVLFVAVALNLIFELREREFISFSGSVGIKGW